MKIIKIKLVNQANNPVTQVCLQFTKAEAALMINKLVNQLADVGGGGCFDTCGIDESFVATDYIFTIGDD